MKILKRIGLLLGLKILDVIHIVTIILILGLMDMAIENSRVFTFGFSCLVCVLIFLIVSWFIPDWKEVKRRIP